MLAGVVLLGVPVGASAASVVEESVAGVSATSATFQACVNPEGSEPAYRFDYGTSVSYGADVSAVAVGAGSCADGVSVEAHVQGLAAGSLYYYRVVVVSIGETVDGAGQSFTTQMVAGGLSLPDGRAWELVSPAMKDGALIVPTQESGGLVQAAEGGGAITYLSLGPVEVPAGNSNMAQVLSVRAAGGGWSSQDIATPHELRTGVVFDSGQEYRFFSSDLSVGLVEPYASGTGAEPNEQEGAAPLSEGASEKTVYLRADTSLSPPSGSSEQAVFNEADAEGGYLPLVTGCPPEGEPCNPRVEQRANAPPGVKFGGRIKFEGATADLSHVILHSGVPLREGETGGGLYEWVAGEPPGQSLRPVSVLPNGEKESFAFLGGREQYDARDAISNNGSRIVWSNGAHLYMTVVSGGKTEAAKLDEFQGGGGEIFKPKFQFASSDGSKVFFTDETQLTSSSMSEEYKPDLYECEMAVVDGELKCVLSDLTVDPESGGHADVQGVVLSGSENSSYLYFVAEGRLSGEERNGVGEEAAVGAENLYMLHYDETGGAWESPVFIAGLSGDDHNDWSGANTVGEGTSLPGDLEGLTSRVSSDGRFLVFMSDGRPTGYDNRDVNSGAPDEEVYLFDGLLRRLVCVSCNPTGERPLGVQDTVEARGDQGLLVDTQTNWPGSWLAGVVPGWTAIEQAVARYQPRYLGDDGRVFFDSSDGLVPEDTNGLMDVYEYEPEGVPADSPRMCTRFSPTFISASDGGCVGLVSSGSSGEESVFLDASGERSGGSGVGPGEEEGEDVFFLTTAPLVAADQDTAFDVYDAHVCSVVAPCSSGGVLPPACVTESSCKAAPSPQSSVFGAPASATFSGPGNFVQLPPNTVKCAKGKRLSGGKCVTTKPPKPKKRKRSKSGKVHRKTRRRGR